MQWATENLPSSFYYSSSDDDMMIDVAALDDNIMKAINTTNHLPYFPFICIYMVVGPYCAVLFSLYSLRKFLIASVIFDKVFLKILNQNSRLKR